MKVELLPCGTAFRVQRGAWVNVRPLDRLDSFIGLYRWLAKRRDSYQPQLDALLTFRKGLSS